MVVRSFKHDHFAGIYLENATLLWSGEVKHIWGWLPLRPSSLIRLGGIRLTSKQWIAASEMICEKDVRDVSEGLNVVTQKDKETVHGYLVAKPAGLRRPRQTYEEERKVVEANQIRPKYRALIASSGDIEFSKKKGAPLSPEEIVGIKRAQIRARVARKKEKQQKRKDEDKKRFLERRRGAFVEVRSKTDTAEWKAAKNREKQKEKNRAEQKKFTKEERSDFRKAKKKQRENKRLRFKKRQAERREAKCNDELSAQTEAGESDYELKEENIPFSDLERDVDLKIDADPEVSNVIINRVLSVSSMTNVQVNDMMRYVREKYATIYRLYEGAENALQSGLAYLKLDELGVFLKMSVFFVGVWKSPTYEMDMILATQYLMSVGADVVKFGTAATAIGAFGICARRRVRRTTEALSDDLNGAASWVTAIFDSEMAMAITNLLVSGIALRLLPDKQIKPFMKYLKLPLRKMGLSDLLDTVLSSLAHLVHVVEQIAGGAEISEVLFSADPMREALRRANSCVQESTDGLVIVGLPREGTRNARDFVAECDEVLKYFNNVLPTLNPMTAKHNRLRMAKNSLQMARAKAYTKLGRKHRICPVAVVVHGPPGIGKSSVMNIIYRVFSEVMGRDFDDSHVYDRVLSSQYWDGYDPVSTPIIHYSECGSTAVEIVRRTGEPAVKELTSLIDFLPYTVDMSDVADKGDVFACPELVAIDTNNRELNLRYTVTNIAAYMRRFLYIEPIVKEKYKIDGGGHALDPSKAFDGEGYFDKWTFNCKYYYAQNATQTREQILLENGDIKEFISVLTTYFKKKIESNTNNMEKQMTFRTDDYRDDEKVLEEKVSLGQTEAGEERNDVVFPFLYRLGTRLVNLGSNFGTACVSSVKFTMTSFVGKYRFIALSLWIMMYAMSVSWGFGHAFLGFMFACFFSVDWKRTIRQDMDITITTSLMNFFGIHQEWLNNTLEIINFVRGVERGYERAKSFVCTPQVLALCSVGFGTFIGMWLGTPARRTESSSFKKKNDVTEEMKSVEDKYGCTVPYKRIPIHGKSKVYNTMMVTPSSHTSTIDSLEDCVLRNSRHVRICFEDGTTATTYGLGIFGDYMLFNYHATHGKTRFVMNVEKSGYPSQQVYQETRVRANDMVQVFSDLWLVRVSSITFRNILKHFPKEDLMFTSSDARIVHNEISVKRISGGMTLKDKHIGTIEIERIVSYEWRDHEKGKCGLPVIAKRDSGFAIVGIHSGADISGDGCYAVSLIHSELMAAMDQLRSKINIFSEAEVESGTLPHCKSPVNYEVLGGITYYGCKRNPMIRQKSKLVKTPMCKDLDEFFFETFGHIRKSVYIPPLMQPTGSGKDFKSPYNLAIRKMSVIKKSLDSNICNKVIDVICAQLKKNCGEFIRLQPLTMESAVNGSIDDAYLRRIDMNKAAGYGTPGKKMMHIYREESKEGVYDEPQEHIIAEVLRTIHCYERGENSRPTFTALLKDEPRLRDKALAGKTRVFYSTPFSFLILQRMFLAPLYTMMVEHSEWFYAALGVDMLSRGQNIYHELSRFSRDIIEGDFGGYDQSMPFEVGMGVNTIIIEMLRHFGYNEMQCTVTAGVLSDLMFPNLDFIGEMFEVPGLQPSGKYATAEDNSLRNLFIQVYVWYVTGHEGNFFDHVLSVSYGDDVLIAVRDTPTYNARSFCRAIEENTSMTFTPANKGSFEDDYISPEEMTFLKRRFVQSAFHGRVVCPLDLDSIYKMLQWRLPSKTLNEEMQLAAMCCSALWEFCFHCESGKQFEACRHFLMNYVNDLPTCEEIMQNLCPDEMAVQGGDQPDGVTESKEGSPWDTEEIDEPECYISFGRLCSPQEWPAMNLPKWESEYANLAEELKMVEMLLDGVSHPMPGSTQREVKTSVMYCSDYRFRIYADRYFFLMTSKEQLCHSMDRMKMMIDRARRGLGPTYAQTESADGEMKAGSADSSAVDTHENLVDVGGEAKSQAYAGDEVTLNVGQDGTLDIQRFLERPITLGSYSIPLGTNFDVQLNIWDLFLNVPSVRAKLRNYAYLKGQMRVRIAISGTPFHYGKVLFSYQPLATFNDNLVDVHDSGLLNASTRFAALIYLSQAPGAKVMDVKNNEPLEMSLPFICQQPTLRLFNKSPLVLGSGASYDDALNMGKLYVSTINQVKSASPTPTSVSMFIYAWMTDVQLSAPTGTVISVATESADEREVGPVERIASRLLSYSRIVQQIPMLAPYATASTQILKGVKGLSALFGFSVPTMNNEPVRVKPQPFQNGANTIGYDTGKRIVLDPKQELTIDPRVTASMEDEMSYAYLCSRPSLLDSFAWDVSTAPLATSLWAAPVNPAIAKKFSLGSAGDMVQPSPLAAVAKCHWFWRGEIELSFEIVCSKYHRGKLAFLIEPNISQQVLIDAVLDLNKQFVRVVDIQEVQHVTFTIPWMFPRAWARVLTDDLLGDLGTVGFLGPDLAEYANGYVAVTPFTSLQSPDGSSIEINVYIRSVKMHFNQVTGQNLPETRPNIGVTESGELCVEETTYMDMNVSTASYDHISEMHFGEQPISFRSVLKRFANWQTEEELLVPTPYTGGLTTLRGLGIIPKIVARFNNTRDRSNQTFLSYLRFMYLGIRGGLRYRISFTDGFNFGQYAIIKIHLDQPKTTTAPYAITYDTFFQRWGSRPVGTVTFVPDTNAGIEFEVPNYTNNLFGISFHDDPYPTDLSTCDPLLSRNVVVILPVVSVDEGTYLIVDHATAEDFSYLRFSGASPFLIPV